MVHNVFSIVASVAPEAVGDVRACLDKSNLLNQILCSRRLPMLHFASIVVFPGQDLGQEVKSSGCLVFESCIDGTVDDYLDALLHAAGPSLRDAFAYCRDFGPQLDPLGPEFRAYLCKGITRPQLLHIGIPWIRRPHVTAGRVLREELDRRLDTLVSARRSDDEPLAIVEDLRTQLNVPDSRHTHWHLDPAAAATDRYRWLSDPVSRWRARLVRWSQLLIAALLVLALVGTGLYVIGNRAGAAGIVVALLAAAIIAWLIRRWLYGHDEPPPVDLKLLEEVRSQEDNGTHNHLATFVILKSGLLRKISIRLVLHSLNLIYRTWFTDVTPGKLQGLPTIHFAHWTIVPLVDANKQRTRREALMFLSNYDGSWDAYLDDFLTFLAPGVIAIWANAVGFPARFDGKRFKLYARMHMARHHGWYQAEPTLTVGNVLNNDQIRLGLLRHPRTDAEARLWLSRFGSLKEGHEHIADDPNALQTSDIQGLVLRGYRNLEHSAYLPIRFGDDPAATRRWLGHVLPLVTDSRHRAKEERTSERWAIHVAFTWRGLERLGLDGAALERFPLAFHDGMSSSPHRSRALGDVGDNEPSKWSWGSPAEPVDALLMLFAKGEADEHGSDALLRQMIAQHRDDISSAGACVVGTTWAITGTFLPSPDKSGPFASLPAEHFGFVDGVSQPQIDQSWQVSEQRSSRPSPADLVKPGEFVLGYPAEDGARTPGIPLSPIRDRLGLLPLAANGSGYVRDFGRNGSYLVVRQLQQHVERFRDYTRRVAAASGPTASVEAAAARMVGRFPNGTSLRPTPKPDSNRFGFADDPHGFECPIGAHIRRANPRDSLGTDPTAALSATKRRRLLRRGRTYGPPLPQIASGGNGDERGLMFMCLNSDIERQFEFVQQNWINGTSFSGLYDESDPIIGRPSSKLMTVQSNALRERLIGLEQFVTVRGGQYFFLPGLGALRYLAALDKTNPSEAVAAPIKRESPIPVPESRQVPVLTRVLTSLQTWLPTAQLAWAIRYPLLLTALLLLFPLSIRTLPTIAPSLFLTGWWGVAALTFVASLAASVVMITVRLVFMYGQRIGLPRPGWQTASTGRSAAFQLLALPIVGTCIHLSASDADSPYWREVFWLSVPAALGWAAGLAVHGIRRLRPPKNGRLARVLQRISRAAIDQIPEELGTGYIDYRQRRIQPGHVFAASLAAIVIAAYAVGYFVLHPAGSARAEGLPSALYVLMPGFLTIWVLSAFAFFLDRYRVPTLLVLIAWVVIVGSVFRTDHVFAVGDSLDAGATPGEVLSRTANDTVVVVMADGLGLVSSAWTSRVLTGLADWPNTGRTFTDKLRLVSASSGATLGAFSFVTAYTKDGFRASRSVSINQRAGTRSSGAGGWGFAYPDFMRTFAPFLVPPYVDRGWAMEQAWARAFGDASTATLGQWRADVRSGWRPATAFTVTAVESGASALLATYQTDSPPVTSGRDVSLLSAVRMSATFPFISPPSRPDSRTPSPHLIDGGFSDNTGLVAGRRWLEVARTALADSRILLVEIRSTPEPAGLSGEEATWTIDLTGPLQTFIASQRAQAARIRAEFEAFEMKWNAEHERPLHHVVFSLNDDRMPLSWNLGEADVAAIKRAWTHSTNKGQLRKALDFLARRVQP